MSKSTEPWYAAKCIFRHSDLDAEEAGAVVYEERIVLVRASDDDSAIAQAESEAEEYARQQEGVDFIGYTTVFHLFVDEIGHLTEVYSEMRESTEAPDAYIDRFYDTGKERVRKQ